MRKQDLCHAGEPVLTVDFSTGFAALKNTAEENFRLMQPNFTILNSAGAVRIERID